MTIFHLLFVSTIISIQDTSPSRRSHFFKLDDLDNVITRFSFYKYYKFLIVKIVNCQLSLSIVNCQLSIVNCQLSIVNCQLSIVKLSIVNCQLSLSLSLSIVIVNCQLSIVSLVKEQNKFEMNNLTKHINRASRGKGEGGHTKIVHPK